MFSYIIIMNINLFIIIYGTVSPIILKKRNTVYYNIDDRADFRSKNPSP